MQGYLGVQRATGGSAGFERAKGFECAMTLGYATGFVQLITDRHCNLSVQHYLSVQRNLGEQRHLGVQMGFDRAAQPGQAATATLGCATGCECARRRGHAMGLGVQRDLSVSHSLGVQRHVDVQRD